YVIFFFSHVSSYFIYINNKRTMWSSLYFDVIMRV
ncbi:uncharacterized protein METZ01_LOCUS167420, partial [marine metagenome]